MNADQKHVKAAFNHSALTDKVEGILLVELKAVRALEAAHEAQTLNYLRATELEIALLLNFGPKPQIRRLAFDNRRKKISVYQRSSAAKGF